ncbi:MAG: glycosyltransferase family 4 protein [Victivallales bacterium]
MKILQILTELGPGGAERVALDLSAELLRRGHDVSLVVLKSPPKNRALADRFLALRIVPEYLHMDRASELYRLYFLRKSIQRIAPDVCHSHLMHPNLCARLAMAGLGIPLLNTVHISERRPGKGIYFALDRLTFPLCSACNAVSFASARFHEEMTGLETGTISVIYNGVNPVPPPAPDYLSTLKHRWGLDGCSRIIGSVGRLDFQKGYDLLLSLLPELSARVPAGERWGIVIVGEGPEMESLRALAAKAPANLTVVLPGFLDSARQAVFLFDAFVMPSRYEGYGLVLAEAMTTGVPVVVNPVDSLPELCRFYRNHAMADFESPERKAETAAILAESVCRPKCSPQVISRKDEMADRYIRLYENLLGTRRKKKKN